MNETNPRGVRQRSAEEARLRLSGGTPTPDVQCGFKAVRTDVFRALGPHVQDNAWFFDSRVDLVRTALDNLRGIRRIPRARLTGGARIPVPHRVPVPGPAGAPRHTGSPAPSLEYAS